MTTKTHPELDTTNDAKVMRECDGDMRLQMVQQIGRNIWAISGGRVVAGKYGIEMQAGCGYHVQVLLRADDTYVVRRLFARGFKVFLHGERTEVYAEDLGEVCYYASCFRSYDADEWPTKA